MATIATRIATRRAELGLSQLQLARSAGITQPHVSIMEHEGCNPNIMTLTRVAHALGLKVNDLTEGM